ncbi:hypothetical protein [Chryseobacterium profundimaris]|uniref:NERD domain-containing protein n=1 Tax=Chryseobacterium profundimaris TaxID=1387275 RepID=A0ABY1P4F6_9FLAO|nr:hypothetical protein [Chryseobacterium profundimaris]SMP23755.1 hypothetical protein SAMN06264346_107172 [Chryseobacterium profundimaris]
MIDFPKDFNIERDSKILKNLLSVYDSENLFINIMELIFQIEPPRMDIYPFQMLDSPYRQLIYMAALNLSSSEGLVTKDIPTKEEWLKIVTQMITVRAGYYDELLKNKNSEFSAVEFDEYYKIAMPIFNNIYDTGELNYEEQIIERISILFTPSDKMLQEYFGLTTSDFINIYNILDNLFHKKLNLLLDLIKTDNDVEKLFRDFKDNGYSTDNIEYNKSENIEIAIEILTNTSEKYSVSIKDIYDAYDQSKIDSFLNIFTISRDESQYLHYTQKNPLLQKPLFKLKNGKILIIEKRTLINSIFYFLENTVLNSNNKNNYEKRRGIWLQNKTENILSKYFKSDAKIYNEYKSNNKGQDILCLAKGKLALIIENKAVKEMEFSGYPNTVEVFRRYVKKFKKSIQEGYDQTWRIKDQFYFENKLEILDAQNNLITIDTNRFHNVFSIIITMDRYREPQINTSELLNKNEDDDGFPLSMSIDDFEILMLSLSRLKIGIGTFINLLKKREHLQGRTTSNDELEIWATLINNPKFKINKNENYTFIPNPRSTNIFDKLYETGLGFNNEKFFKEKKNKSFLIINSVDRLNEHPKHKK